VEGGVLQHPLVVRGPGEGEGVGEDVPLVQGVPDDRDERTDDEEQPAEDDRGDEGVAPGGVTTPPGGPARTPAHLASGEDGHQSAGRGSMAEQTSSRTPSTSAEAVHSESSSARTAASSWAKFRWAGLTWAPMIPSTTARSSCSGESSGFASPRTSVVRRDSRGGGQEGASFSALSGLVKQAGRSAAIS